jgi:hypothetical protein
MPPLWYADKCLDAFEFLLILRALLLIRYEAATYFPMDGKQFIIDIYKSL